MSRWISEAVWRQAIKSARKQLKAAQRPDFILYHDGVADAAYTQKHVAKIRSRIDRIHAAGRPQWQERLDANWLQRLNPLARLISALVRRRR